jgi:hypothetical protein
LKFYHYFYFLDAKKTKASLRARKLEMDERPTIKKTLEKGKCGLLSCCKCCLGIECLTPFIISIVSTTLPAAALGGAVASSLFELLA